MPETAKAPARAEAPTSTRKSSADVAARALVGKHP
jgi:hypothetical protein